MAISEGTHIVIATSLYNSDDNRLHASSAIKNDVGVTLTLGWTF
jgi:hypothetical protein